MKVWNRAAAGTSGETQKFACGYCISDFLRGGRIFLEVHIHRERAVRMFNHNAVPAWVAVVGTVEVIEGVSFIYDYSTCSRHNFHGVFLHSFPRIGPQNIVGSLMVAVYPI